MHRKIHDWRQMDEKTEQSHNLWEWCLQNLEPNTRWRFDAPTQGDVAVILEVHNIHWDQPASRFDIEFETISVVEPNGERQAAPHRVVTLPDWFVALQAGPTPLFMSSMTFKKYVDAGQIRNLAPEQA